MINNIRIFLSSTFKDMQRERDYLVKNVFPALRNVAENRGIPFSWCDLRFGVSSFEEEDIIRLCLKNIESCSPCFVGLMGESYGSIPQNLNKEQIRRLSVFHGIPPMIKRRYGYTEIEMRYFISQKGGNDNFDFYFFIGEFDTNDYKIVNWKYFLTHPITSVSLLFKKSKEDRLNSWKRYVFTKSNQISPCYWLFDDNESLNENIIYQSIKSLLESKFPVLQFPKEELIWNEQQVYMQLQISETFTLENIKKEFRYDSSKDILNIYSQMATGKTIYVANLLKKLTDDGCVCFYYFIGASRGIDTPLNIWKCILYQVCKYRNIDYGLYNHINSMDELRNVITLLIHQISKDVLIAIDGFGDDVSCSIEHKNTFISDFPAPQYNIKYILSSSHKLSETSRVLSIEHKITNSIIEKFIEDYLKFHYGYSFYNKRISLQSQPKDLREVRYSIDEAIINKKCVFVSKDIHSRDNLYESIKSRIISNIGRQCDFYEGDKQIYLGTVCKAIQFLSLTKYGILEPDICNICNINAEQWTIIYSYLSPFFKSKGYIKLNESLAKQFSQVEDCDITRIQFIENLQDNNKSSQYTAEILFQASQLNSKSRLCEILSNIDILNELYETDKDLLTEYIVIIDKASLLNNFEYLLEKSLQSKTTAELPSLLFRIINIFHKLSPRYAVALHYIDITNRLIKDNPISIEHQLEYNAQRTDIYIEMGRFDEALELLLLSDRIIKNCPENLDRLKQYTVNNLLLKAKLYHNDLQESNERIKALEIYRELIDKHQDYLETDSILYVLDRYIISEKRGEIVEKYINIFDSIFFNQQIVKENSHLFNKYAVKQIIHHTLCNYRFDAEAKEVDDLFTILFCKMNECLRMYPYSYDNFYNMHFVIELLSARTNKLYNKNLFGTYRENIITLKAWVKKFVSLTMSTYKESIGYVKAMSLSARLYDQLAQTLPLNKNEYLNKSINDSIEAEKIFDKIYQGHNIIIAKLYHNRAGTYSSAADFKNALFYINRAIDIKNKLMHSEDDSIFNSKLRRVSIFIDQIIYTEDLNSISKEIDLCYFYLKELKLETTNDTELSNHRRNERLMRIDEIEKKYNLYINNPKEKHLEVARRTFEESKRVIKYIQNQIKKDELNTIAFKDDLISLVKRAKDLDSYLERHELHQIFYEKCNDYIDFECLFKNIYSILKQ